MPAAIDEQFRACRASTGRLSHVTLPIGALDRPAPAGRRAMPRDAGGNTGEARRPVRFQRDAPRPPSDRPSDAGGETRQRLPPPANPGRRLGDQHGGRDERRRRGRRRSPPAVPASRRRHRRADGPDRRRRRSRAPRCPRRRHEFAGQPARAGIGAYARRKSGRLARSRLIGCQFLAHATSAAHSQSLTLHCPQGRASSTMRDSICRPA